MTLRRSVATAFATIGSAAVLAACATQEAPTSSEPAANTTETAAAATTPDGDGGQIVARADLVDPSGATRGSVEFRNAEGGVEVQAQAEGLEPGFHGFHIHEIGRCEADSPDPADPSNTGNFLSAGSHIADEGTSHPDHIGDLSVLQVTETGQARLMTMSDRLTPDAMLDDDGSAVIVHENPDNYANIPTRYASAGPDEDTRNTGDAGGRLLCGVVAAP